MGYEMANENLEVKFTNNSGPAGLVYAGDQSLDSVKIVAQKSSKVNAPGGASAKKICHTNIALTFSGPSSPCPFSSATYNFVSGGGSITMSKLTKVKESSNTPDAKGDVNNTACSGSWTLKAVPHTLVVCSCKCEISDAGQTKAVAE